MCIPDTTLSVLPSSGNNRWSTEDTPVYTMNSISSNAFLEVLPQRGGKCDSIAVDGM